MTHTLASSLASIFVGARLTALDPPGTSAPGVRRPRRTPRHLLRLSTSLRIGRHSPARSELLSLSVQSRLRDLRESALRRPPATTIASAPPQRSSGSVRQSRTLCAGEKRPRYLGVADSPPEAPRTTECSSLHQHEARGSKDARQRDWPRPKDHGPAVCASRAHHIHIARHARGPKQIGSSVQLECEVGARPPLQLLQDRPDESRGSLDHSPPTSGVPSSSAKSTARRKLSGESPLEKRLEPLPVPSYDLICEADHESRRRAACESLDRRAHRHVSTQRHLVPARYHPSLALQRGGPEEKPSRGSAGSRVGLRRGVPLALLAHEGLHVIHEGSHCPAVAVGVHWLGTGGTEDAGATRQLATPPVGCRRHGQLAVRTQWPVYATDAAIAEAVAAKCTVGTQPCVEVIRVLRIRRPVERFAAELVVGFAAVCAHLQRLSALARTGAAPIHESKPLGRRGIAELDEPWGHPGSRPRIRVKLDHGAWRRHSCAQAGVRFAALRIAWSLGEKARCDGLDFVASSKPGRDLRGVRRVGGLSEHLQGDLRHLVGEVHGLHDRIHVRAQVVLRARIRGGEKVRPHQPKERGEKVPRLLPDRAVRGVEGEAVAHDQLYIRSQHHRALVDFSQRLSSHGREVHGRWDLRVVPRRNFLGNRLLEEPRPVELLHQIDHPCRGGNAAAGTDEGHSEMLRVRTAYSIILLLADPVAGRVRPEVAHFALEHAAIGMRLRVVKEGSAGRVFRRKPMQLQVLEGVEDLKAVPVPSASTLVVARRPQLETDWTVVPLAIGAMARRTERPDLRLLGLDDPATVRARFAQLVRRGGEVVSDHTSNCGRRLEFLADEP
eukprot:scaffold301_cov243-Pinguiococcus_pyrenoidosus.AAC.17